MSGRIAFVLTTILVLCALSVVNAHYQSRTAFIALEREQAKTRQIEIDWRQLQLDQSTLGVHGRSLTQTRQRHAHHFPHRKDQW